MNRNLEYRDKERKQLNRLSITDCGGMKSGDIQIFLEKMNFNGERKYSGVGIEFMSPGAAGREVYETHKTLWQFIYNNNWFLHQNNDHLRYEGQEISTAIRGDFKQWTCYLQISNTTNNILNILVKWWQQNNHIEPADKKMNVNLILPEKISLYTGNPKDIIMITQEELQRILKLMKSIDQDLKASPETFTARK